MLFVVSMLIISLYSADIHKDANLQQVIQDSGVEQLAIALRCSECNLQKSTVLPGHVNHGNYSWAALVELYHN